MSGDDDLREAIASAAWDGWVNAPGEPWRRIADAVLALPELAALRAKADAADRVRELAEEYERVAAEARADIAPGIDGDTREYLTRVAAAGDKAATRIRAALDGPPPC